MSILRQNRHIACVSILLISSKNISIIFHSILIFVLMRLIARLLQLFAAYVVDKCTLAIDFDEVSEVLGDSFLM